MSFDRPRLRQEVKSLSYPLVAAHPELGNAVKDPVTPLAVVILIAAAFFLRPRQVASRRRSSSSCSPPKAAAPAACRRRARRAERTGGRAGVQLSRHLLGPARLAGQLRSRGGHRAAGSLPQKPWPARPVHAADGDRRVDVVGSSRSGVLRAIDLLTTHGDHGPAITVEAGRVSLAAGNQGAATW